MSIAGYLEDNAPPRVNDAQRLVLAHGTDGISVLVPANAVDQVRVGVGQLVQQFPRADVPHHNRIVAASGRSTRGFVNSKPGFRP